MPAFTLPWLQLGIGPLMIIIVVALSRISMRLVQVLQPVGILSTATSAIDYASSQIKARRRKSQSKSDISRMSRDDPALLTKRESGQRLFNRDLVEGLDITRKNSLIIFLIVNY